MLRMVPSRSEFRHRMTKVAFAFLSNARGSEIAKGKSEDVWLAVDRGGGMSLSSSSP